VLVALILVISIGANNQQNPTQKPSEHPKHEQGAERLSTTAVVKHAYPAVPANGKGKQAQSCAWYRIFQFPEDAKFIDKATFWIAAFTFIYMMFTILMWNAMRHTLNLARLDMRPWVTLRDFGVTGKKMTFQANQQKSFMILMKNTGKTPAFVREGGTAIRPYINVPTQIPHFTPPPAAPILSPGDEHFLEAIVPAMPQADWNAIANGTLHLIVFIVIRYEDTNGKSHDTAAAHEFRRTAAGVWRWATLANLSAMT